MASIPRICLDVVGETSSHTDPCTFWYVNNILRFLALPLDITALPPRFSLHTGSHTEVQYALMTFGIDCSLLPVSQVGEIDLSSHLHWLEERTELEGRSIYTEPSRIRDSCAEIRTSQEHIFGSRPDISPGPNDVIFGRGSIVRQHPGNVRYHDIIEEHSSEYESSGKFEKTVVSEIIVRTIKEKHGGRFLKQDRGNWGT